MKSPINYLPKVYIHTLNIEQNMYLVSGNMSGCHASGFIIIYMRIFITYGIYYVKQLDNGCYYQIDYN